MALPSNFNDFEFLQDMIRRWQNRVVREEFKHLGADDFDPDINISEHALRVACTHKDSDTATMMQMRNDLFYIIYGKAKQMQGAVYTIPTTELHISNTIYPQVILCFREKAKDALSNDRYPLRATHYVRTQHDFASKADVKQLAQKVKSIFATPTFSFDKGKIKYTYLEKAKGYNIIVACPSEPEARPLVERLLQVNNHTPNWNYLNESKSNQNFNHQETVKVNGETEKKAKRRQSGKVYFTHAELAIPGVTRNIFLVDVNREYPGAIIYA
jgi:hypothetical protein